MRFQRRHDVQQLPVRRRIKFAERRKRQRVSDSGHHVFALGIGQVVAVNAARAASRIAGERNAGSRTLPNVSEGHGLNVHGRPQPPGNPFLPAVQHRSFGVPGPEDRQHRKVKLALRLLREVLPGAFADDALEVLNDGTQRINVEFGVGIHPCPSHRTAQDHFKSVAVDFQNSLAEHLNQAPVRIPGEALVSRDRGQAEHAVVVEPDIQHRLHHSGHRESGTRTD